MTWPTTRYPTSREIYDRLIELQARPTSSPLCSVDDLAPTSGSNKTNFIRIGKRPTGQTSAAVVVITGGVHAREWAPPIAIVNLVEALLDAAVSGTKIDRGGFSVSPADVSDIIAKVDLYVAPMINPDGYNFSIASDSTSPLLTRTSRGWRKNRRAVSLLSKPAGCTTKTGTGVDINRNFGVLWDYTTCYAGAGANVHSSRCPDNDTFIGESAFSEIETRNVRTLLQNNPAFYVDVHMYGPTILHSWGIETNKPVTTATPVPPCATTPQRDGTLTSGGAFTGYEEPINQDELKAIVKGATAMNAAVKAATGADYKVQPGAQFYPTSGAADDFAYFRSLGGGAPTLAYTIECGTTFLPLFATELPDIQNEVHAALLALLKHAASTIVTSGGGSSGSGSPAPTATPNAGPGTGASGSACFLFRVYEDAQHPTLQFLRGVRDHELVQSRFGRAVRDAVVRTYNRCSPRIARYLARRRRRRAAIRWLAVEPAVAAVRLASRLAHGWASPPARSNALAAMLVMTLAAIIAVVLWAASAAPAALLS